MKKIFTLCIVLFSFANLFAQGLEDILLDDFESGEVSFTEEVNVNPPAHMDVAVVDNPVKAGINTSNKVWEWKRYDAESANVIWAGFYATLKNEIPNGYHRIEVKYLRTNETSQLKIKCEGAVTKEISSVTPATKTNEWETLVFDLTENEIKNIKVFGMFPDFYEPIDPTAVTYIDDIKIIYDESVTPPPGPTSLVLFDNSESDRFYDQSWSTTTAPSTLVQEHWQEAGLPDGDKLPVVTEPVKAGTNALKLQWKSAEGGSWMALVASIGWKMFDLTTMDTLKFWINSPVDLSKAALPKFFFEAGSGDPNKTGKLLLADYIEADLVANTWTEVNILLSDVWAADETFIAKDIIKGIFFEQNAADNVEHTLYLDEFIFKAKEIPVVTSVLFFDNSADNRFHDQSWSTKTAPSTLVQEHWEGPGLPDGDKLPVVTEPVKAGANALKLQWKSVEGGSWMAMVAALDWKSFDLTTMKNFKFWIYSPEALPKSALPKFFLESHSGDPNKTGKLMLADYVATDLAANTWTEVNIILADVWAADETFTAKDVIKGIFFEQNAADNIEHTLYLDEFYFISDEVPPVIDELILFENSESDRFYDQSWSNKTEPSTLVQEHWQEAGLPDGDKLPVVTSPVRSGPNALKMQWKSAEGGSWMAMVASIGWKSFDLTDMKTLKFWINSPVDLAKTALPKFFLESHSGNPNKSGKLLLADYVDADLVADTWTEVNISLADVWAADETFTAKDVVKGIFFEQNTADNVEHTLYMDDFKFVSTATGIKRPVKNSEIHAYYSNGEIRISNYSGNVRVFDLVGRKVAEGPAYDGNFRVNLKTGIYIVNTTKGSTKIALQ
ncbi:MAG: hypothetical protein K0B11_17455 [Mariniphaga sp.]|nr:hypothetical protein [Mariniphaga sp.]